MGDLRRRVPHIKSLRRPVTDEGAPSPVHFVIHILQHARATRRNDAGEDVVAEGQNGKKKRGWDRRKMGSHSPGRFLLYAKRRFYTYCQDVQS